jgi:hypothetical protein
MALLLWKRGKGHFYVNIPEIYTPRSFFAERSGVSSNSEPKGTVDTKVPLRVFLL